MKIKHLMGRALGLATISLVGQTAFAACSDVPDLATVQSVANDVRANDVATLTKGLQNQMWITVTDKTGKVCVVANTAGSALLSRSTWSLSRVISAQKANTVAGLSLDGQPWSTAMLYAAAQPGGFLYGLQASNPVDATIAYVGTEADMGTANDPLINKHLGGINVFGGGLPLYSGGTKIGAIGVSGDTSCTDHAFAWRMRIRLADAGLVDASSGDEMVYDDTTTTAVDGHPRCLGTTLDPVTGASTGITDPG
jgi:uncharacterized protein GlcG (DUF336 family)